MNRYTFTVDVVTDTAEHAHMVMVERLASEMDDLGFPYRVSWVVAKGTPSPVAAGQRRRMGATVYTVGECVITDSGRRHWFITFEGGGQSRWWLEADILEDEVLP